MRSTSVRRLSYRGCSATSVSSRKPRRPDGPPFTNSRSSGENTLARSTPSRSRVRWSRCLLTYTRPRPETASSASMSTSRPLFSPSARITALVAPALINASVGAPRNDDSVARYDRASSRLVLPCPFAPSTAVTPPANSTAASGYERKSVSQRRRTSNAALGDSDRHEEVQELAAVGGSDHRRLERVERRDHDLVARSDLDAVEQVLRVERHRELVAFVLCVELLVGLADVLGDRHQLEAVTAHHQPHGGGLTGHQLHAAHRLEERLAADGELVRIARRDQPAVVGELALDQPCGQPDGADLERGVAFPEAEFDGFGSGEHPCELGQRPRRHKHLLAFRQHRRARQVAHREPVR